MDFEQTLNELHDNSLKTLSKYNNLERVTGVLKFDHKNPEEILYFFDWLRQRGEYYHFGYTTIINQFDCELKNIKIQSDIYYIFDPAYKMCSILYTFENNNFFSQTSTHTSKDSTW